MNQIHIEQIPNKYNIEIRIISGTYNENRNTINLFDYYIV